MSNPDGGKPRRWRFPRPQASLGGRLLCLLLLAACPVLVLVLAGAVSEYRGATRRAQADLALERDLVVAAFATRIAAADGVLRGVSGNWQEGSGRCGPWPEAALPEGVTLEVECAAGASPGRASFGPELRVRLAGSAGALILAGASGEISVLRLLPASSRVAMARVTPPPLPAGLFGWLLDARGRSWPLGETAPAWAPPTTRSDSVVSALLPDGEEAIAARGTLAANATLVVARPIAPIRAEATAAITQRLIEIGALLALSILAVVLGAEYAVSRPLSRLRRAVAQWQAGARTFEISGTSAMPDEVRDLAESFRAGAFALSARERDLQAAIERAEILAAEVHHRVKNNLQIVSSLLALQAQRLTDGQGRAEFEAARDRIGALATLHRHMYAHHDPEAIDLRAFIEELGAQLFAAVGDKPGRRIALAVTAPALRISSDQAVPLALIITEAVSAALKQGFPPGRGGRIAIDVTADERRARLAIEDDGVTPRPDDPLRTMLLRGLARQLGGELKRTEAGLALEFLLRPPTPRPLPALRPSPAPTEARKTV